MNWQMLTNREDITVLSAKSELIPQIIFKHSTRCATSSLARERLNRASKELSDKASLWYIPVIENRVISSHIAETFQVIHESPQVLLIYKNECILEQSHIGIDIAELRTTLNLLNLSG